VNSAVINNFLFICTAAPKVNSAGKGNVALNPVSGKKLRLLNSTSPFSALRSILLV